VWNDIKKYPWLYLTEIYITLFELLLFGIAAEYLPAHYFILFFIGVLFYAISKVENKIQIDNKRKIEQVKIDSKNIWKV